MKRRTGSSLWILQNTRYGGRCIESTPLWVRVPYPQVCEWITKQLNQLLLSLHSNGLSQKNPDSPPEDMEFPGVLKKSMWKFQKSIKKEQGFPGVFKKNSDGIFMGLGFWPWSFKGCHRVLQNFQGWKLLLSRISKDKLTNLKIPRGVRKLDLQPPPSPVWIFSGIAQCDSVLLHKYSFKTCF